MMKFPNENSLAHFPYTKQIRVREILSVILLAIAADILVISTRDVKTLRPKLWSTKRE